MSGDSKIGLQAVGGIVRAAAPRKIAGDAAAPTHAPTVVRTSPEPLPAPHLIGLAGEIADRGPPVDVSRVAALRTAIAKGSYSPDPARIADAMVAFYRPGAA